MSIHSQTWIHMCIWLIWNKPFYARKLLPNAPKEHFKILWVWMFFFLLYPIFMNQSLEHFKKWSVLLRKSDLSWSTYMFIPLFLKGVQGSISCSFSTILSFQQPWEVLFGQEKDNLISTPHWFILDYRPCLFFFCMNMYKYSFSSSFPLLL